MEALYGWSLFGDGGGSFAAVDLGDGPTLGPNSFVALHHLMDKNSSKDSSGGIKVSFTILDESSTVPKSLELRLLVLSEVMLILDRFNGRSRVTRHTIWFVRLWSSRRSVLLHPRGAPWPYAVAPEQFSSSVELGYGCLALDRNELVRTVQFLLLDAVDKDRCSCQ